MARVLHLSHQVLLPRALLPIQDPCLPFLMSTAESRLRLQAILGETQLLRYDSRQGFAEVRVHVHDWPHTAGKKPCNAPKPCQKFVLG